MHAYYAASTSESTGVLSEATIQGNAVVKGVAMARSILLVPPLVKYASGPFLGPALLAGRAAARGHEIQVLDLNIRWIREQLPDSPLPGPTRIHGDHDKPSFLLDDIQDRYASVLACHLPPHGNTRRNAALTLPFGNAAVHDAARSLAGSSLGRWLSEQLVDEISPDPEPDLVGVSVMYSGQVLVALALSRIARKLWPRAKVVWGGTHVAALRDAIACGDGGHGRWIDGFVRGHAEQTFVDILDWLDGRAARPRELVAAGAGDFPRARAGRTPDPHFEQLDLYGLPRLTLPVQTSRGCRYSRCRFCTYPAIEGRVTALGTDAVRRTQQLARQRGAAIAFKDSHLPHAMLARLTRVMDGSTAWSGSTRLDSRLTPGLLARLVTAGCRTLEFGLETTLPRTQALIDKALPIDTVRGVLGDCIRAGIFPVVNVITGFPGEGAAEGRRMVHEVDLLLRQLGGEGGYHLEHNRFELERLAPLTGHPAIEITESWPWASVLEWRWLGRGSGVEKAGPALGTESDLRIRA